MAVRSRPLASSAGGRHHHAQARQVGEDRFARLAVIDRAPRQVAANRHADDHRTGESVVRPPAQHGQLIADLHHRRPDVVEELNFHHRLQPADGHADGAAHNAGLRQRGVVAARAAKLPLQAVGDFEDSALAFHLGQIAFMAAVGNVLAENHDARIASHLILQAGIDEIHHRLGLAVKLGRMIEVFGSGIHAGGVNVLKNGFALRAASAARAWSAASRISCSTRRLDFLQLLFRNPLFLRQEPGQTGHGVALRLLLAHFLRLIKPLVVGKRMRIRAHHVGVNQRRPFSLPHVFNRLACRLVTLGKIRAVAFQRQQMGKAPDQAGNLPPAVCTSTGTEMA